MEHILPSEKAFAYKMMMKMESDGVRMTFRFAEQEPETDVKENIVNILTSQFIRRTVSAP